MKALTEDETKLLDALELVRKGFDSLPYHLEPPHGNEKGEFKKRIDEAKYIIAIRGMLRNGVGSNVTEKTSLGYKEANLLNTPENRELLNNI